MVRCTFSPARAWRPAVVARLARTLGFRIPRVCCLSRKCACRREMNSHEAVQLPTSQSDLTRLPARADHLSRANSLISIGAGVSAGRSKRTRKPPEAAIARSILLQSGVAVARSLGEEVSQVENLGHLQATEFKNSRAWSALQGAERHARFPAGAADAEYRDCSCRDGEPQAQCPACQCTPPSCRAH